MNRFVWLASGSMLAVSAGTAQADYVLDILHTNDVHSRIQSVNKYNSTCAVEDEAEGKCFGGMARIKARIDERRAALAQDNANVLVLDAGDQFQGSLFYTTYKGEVAAELLNMIRPDAMAVGNHEFDDGAETLSKFVDKAEFPVISANTSAYFEPLLKDKLPGYVIVEKGGEKIGIVSVVAADTKELSSPGDNVAFAGEISVLKSAIPEIQSQGVNKIIALTHVGLAMDKQIAASVSGIDVIVGGHSHSLLSNGEESAAGPYPVWVENPDGVKVPIVQAGAYSKYLGEISVNFNDEGVVTAAYGEPHLLDSSVTPDAAVAARVAELAAPIEELKKKPVGETAAVIDGDRSSCRVGECAMGNLVADAMLERVKGQGVTIAIQNGGGLRASIDEGLITMGEVLEVLPFQNSLSTFELKGSDVMAALENGVSQVEEIKGRFPQVSGLRFSWDDSAEPLKGRVKQVQVMADGKWSDLDPDATYKVVSNDFMRGGGDGYAVFKDKGLNAYDYGPGLEEVVADHLAANSPYKPYTDGRILKGGMFEMAMTEAPAAAEEPAQQEETAIEESSTAEETMTGDHVVKAGDTLWFIAKEHYGDALEWKKIETANSVENVRRLHIGDKLVIPQ